MADIDSKAPSNSIDVEILFSGFAAGFVAGTDIEQWPPETPDPVASANEPIETAEVTHV
jgi:hypothetical protein